MERLGVYPLKSSAWLRLAKRIRHLEPGMTTAGSRDCAWLCPGCCEKWTHAKQATYRFLIAAPYLDTAHAGDEVFCAYIGTLLDPKAKGKDAEIIGEADQHAQRHDLVATDWRSACDAATGLESHRAPE